MIGKINFWGASCFGRDSRARDVSDRAVDEVALVLDLRIGYAQRFTSDADNFCR